MVPDATAKINNLRDEIHWLDNLDEVHAGQRSLQPSPPESSSALQDNGEQLSNITAREGDPLVPSADDDLSQDFPDPTTPDDDETPVDELTVQPTDNPTPVETRPSRHRRPTYKLMNQENDGMTRLCTAIGCMVQRLFENSPVAAMHTVFKEKLNDTVNDHRNRLQILDNTIEMNVDGSLNNLHPLTFVAKSGKNDTFHFNGALQQDDREEFIKVMVKELEEHHRNKHWKLVLRSTIGEAKTVKAI